MAAKEETVEELRAKREALHERIEGLRGQTKMLSERIREREGPIPDRKDRPEKGAGYTIAPAK